MGKLNKVAILMALTMVMCLPASSWASTGVPERFFVDFQDLNLVFTPNGRTVQVSAGNKVLSYGSDWEVSKLKPYLFHIRQKVWRNFYFKVNSSRKIVLKITGGTFGKLGGREQKINGSVNVIGGGNIRVSFGRGASPYMVVVPKTKTIQVAATSHVFSYGNDMTLVQLKPYLYHFRQKFWKSFHWAINTSRKEIYEVTRGRFGRLGGKQTKRPYKVRVVGGAVAAAQPAAPKSVKINFNELHMVFTPNGQTLQISASGKVLSYGQNYRVAKLKPYLYHVKRSNWQGFYWKVNTSRKELYHVTGGRFGKLGGRERKLLAKISTIGGGNTRIVFGRAARPYLIFEPAKRGLQVVAHSVALDYGQQWTRKRLKPYLYHLKQNVWKDFHWQVNTSRKEVNYVRNGTFGSLGGTKTKEPFTMTVR